MIYEKLQKHLENEERLKEETLNNLEKNTTQKKLVLKSLEDKLNENGTKGFELEKYFKISEGLLSKLTNT